MTPPRSAPPSGVYAAIDVGSNSVKCLVARAGRDGIEDTLLDTLITTRLGEGVMQTGRLGAVPLERTTRAVADLATAARRAGAASIRVTGTSAAREAENADDLRDAVQRASGLSLEILSGDNEALLTFVGTVGGARGRTAVMDLGGGSTEMAVGVDGTVQWRRSFPVGAVKVTEQALPSDLPTPEEVGRAREMVRDAFLDAPDLGCETAVGIGGTVKALTSVVLGGRGGEESSLLTAEDVARLAAVLARTPVAARREIPGLPPDRADIILGGALVLDEAMRKAGLRGVQCTLRGLRHGVVLGLARGA